MKRNYKKRQKWSDVAEKTLISIWKEKNVDLRRSKKNGHVYSEITKQLQEMGFSYNAEEVHNKIHNMVCRYR